MMLVVREKFIHVSSLVFHSVFLRHLHAHTYAIKNVLAEKEKDEEEHGKFEEKKNLPVFRTSYDTFMHAPS